MHLTVEGKENQRAINKQGIRESVDIRREWPIASRVRISRTSILWARAVTLMVGVEWKRQATAPPAVTIRPCRKRGEGKLK